MTKDEIIDGYDLTFDPADPENGSLYLCHERNGEKDAQRDRLVGELREQALWSDTEPKQVPDEHREAYREQLEFIEAASYRIDAETVTIARFDHPKFPSSATRFEQWKQTFDQRYTRRNPE